MMIIFADHSNLCPSVEHAWLQTWALVMERKREWQDVSKIKIVKGKYNKVRNNK